MNKSQLKHRKLTGIASRFRIARLQGKWLSAVKLSLAITIFRICAAAGDDRPMAAAASTWKVTQHSADDHAQAAEHTLKVDAGALTGTLSNVSTVKRKASVKEWPIKELKIQGDEISFSVTHPVEVGRGDVTAIYQGKISGDSIKGTFTIEVLGHSFTRDWEAERVK